MTFATKFTGSDTWSEITWKYLAEAVRVTVEAVRVLSEAMRVITEAVRKVIEAVRLFV